MHTDDTTPSWAEVRVADFHNNIPALYLSAASAPIIDNSASLLSLITSPRHQRPSSTASHHKSYTPTTPRQAGRMTAGAVTYSVNPPTASGVARIGSMRCGASPLKHQPSPTSYQADGRLAPLRASEMRYCPREAPNKNIFCQRKPSVNTEKHTAVPFLS